MRLFHPGGFHHLADAASIGGVAFMARTKNPQPALSRWTQYHCAIKHVPDSIALS